MRPGFHNQTAKRGWRLPGATLMLAGLALLVYLIPGLDALLEYQREALAAGQLWRLVSSHWSHFSLGHLSWDLLAFLVLGAACERRHRGRFLITVSGSALVVTLSVWIFLPGMAVYRGLSGIDSALFGLLAVLLIRDALRRRSLAALGTAVLFLVLFTAKTFYEINQGTSVFVSNYGAAVVPVPLAHLFGAITGVVAGLVQPMAQKPSPRCCPSPYRRPRTTAAGCRVPVSHPRHTV